MHMLPLAWGFPEPFELLIIGFFGLLLFGKRLPEVGRSIGKGIVEFRKGLSGIEEEINQSTNPKPAAQLPPAAPQQTAALPTQSTPAEPYRFDPHTGKPLRFDPYTGKPMAEEPVASASSGENIGSGRG